MHAITTANTALLLPHQDLSFSPEEIAYSGGHELHPENKIWPRVQITKEFKNGLSHVVACPIARTCISVKSQPLSVPLWRFSPLFDFSGYQPTTTESDKSNVARGQLRPAAMWHQVCIDSAEECCRGRGKMRF